MPMPSLGSILGTVGNVAAAGARMYGAEQTGEQQGRIMRQKMIREALEDLKAQREARDYQSPQDKAAFETQAAVDRERQMGPVRTQNAVGQATALGPVQAANAARTEATTRPGRLATALGVAEATAPVQRATHAANRAYDIAHPMPTTTSPESEVGYYQALVDDAMNAANGDIHDAWNKAIRLDSRARALVLAGKLTRTDFEAGYQRWRNRETLMRQRETGLTDKGVEPPAMTPPRQDEAPRPTPTPADQHPTSAPSSGTAATAPRVPLADFITSLRRQNPGITKDQVRLKARGAGYSL